MAIDLRGVITFPHFHTLTGLTTTTEIKLPSGARYITVGCEAKKTIIAQNGATDGAAAPAHVKTVPSGTDKRIKLGVGRERVNVFVAVDSTPGNIEIMLTE